MYPVCTLAIPPAFSSNLVLTNQTKISFISLISSSPHRACSRLPLTMKLYAIAAVCLLTADVATSDHHLPSKMMCNLRHCRTTFVSASKCHSSRRKTVDDYPAFRSHHTNDLSLHMNMKRLSKSQMSDLVQGKLLSIAIPIVL